MCISGNKPTKVIQYAKLNKYFKSFDFRTLQSLYEKRKNVIIIIIWEHRNQIGIWTEETPQPMRKSFQWENQLKCNACEIVGGAAIKIPM